MIFNKNLKSVALLLLLAVSTVACFKTEFDQPDGGNIVPDAVANTTIASLKKLHVTPKGFDKIPDDIVIRGEVVMDDRSGNYYKTITIQDETGGIDVKFNDGYLYTQFPIGRTIFIKCKGMLLTDFNGLTQIIGGTIEEGGVTKSVGITEAQVATNVVKGNFAAAPLAAKIVKINEITADMVSTLIRLEDVQFISADSDKTYADPVTQNSLNRKLEDCSGRQLILRSSGYASFAADKTPTGKGSIVGVLSIYNNDYQLYIRDLSDVVMPGARCGNNGGGGGGTTSSLNETFEGGKDNDDVALSGWYNIAVKGNRNWIYRSFSGNRYAQNTAFQANQAAMESWLITPGIDLKTAKTLTFESAQAFFTHAGLEVYISNNFTGDVNAATWTKLNCTLADASTPNYDWVKSGNVALPIYSTGVGHIGFKYLGSSTNSQTTTYRLDNIKVQ